MSPRLAHRELDCASVRTVTTICSQYYVVPQEALGLRVWSSSSGR